MLAASYYPISMALISPTHLYMCRTGHSYHWQELITVDPDPFGQNLGNANPDK